MAKRGALASAFENPESIGLLTAGLGILANNNGHYGQFGPAFGKGALMGLETYLPLAQQKRDEARRKAALEGLINIGNRKPVTALPAGKPQRQTFPGQTPDFNPMAKESSSNISLNEITANPAEAFKLPMEQIEGSLPTSVTQGINLDGGEEQPQLGPSAPSFSFGMPQDSASPIAPNLETEIGALQQKKQAAYGNAINAADAALAMQPQGIGALNSAIAMNTQKREQPQQPQTANIGNQVASASPVIDRATLEALAAHAEATGDYSMFNAAMQQQIFPQKRDIEFVNSNGTIFAFDKNTGTIVNKYDAPREAKPPQMRRVTQGEKELDQQWNQANGQWETVGEGPRWNPNPSPAVQVDVNSKGESAFAKDMGESTSKRLNDSYTKAQSAMSSFDTFAEAKKLLNDGIISGSFADIKLRFGKVFTPEMAANTEAFISTMGRTVFDLVKNLGAGNGISNADVKFAEKVAGGEIALNEASIRKIVDIGERAAQVTIDRHNRLYDGVQNSSYGGSIPFDMRIERQQTQPRQSPSSYRPDEPVKIGDTWYKPTQKMRNGKRVYMNETTKQEGLLQ